MLCAMVKANAYGHGVKIVCETLKDIANFFGVATVGEAKEIRKFNKTTPILVVGLCLEKQVAWCAKNNVSVTVNSLDELIAFEKELKQLVVNIHFKINTGLNRIGFSSVDQFLLAYEFAKQQLCFLVQGVFTHFATKQNDEHFIEQQHKQFMKFLAPIETSSLIIHCCNSYATDRYPEFHHNMVRCGFSLYGWENETYLPVLNITSKVLAVQQVAKGETVGYDRTYVAPSNQTIAVVSIGYADGFDRRNSNLASVLIHGQWAPVVGLVCMDVCMVDVTNIENVTPQTTVTILGTDGNYTLSPHYYANLLKTSPYEILLKFNHRRMNVRINAKK